MQLLTQPQHERLSPSVATIGFFDGVHVGHRYLLEQVKEIARCKGLGSMVITFSKHPRKVMHPETSIPLLNTVYEKTALIEQSGIECCVLLDFTIELSQLTACEFMRFLRDSYRVVSLVIGYDHRFGRNRLEGFDDYRHYGRELGVDVVLAKPFLLDGVDIGSTLIRECLNRGDVAHAAEYLGDWYKLCGKVVPGHHIGRTLGFPTANLKIADADKIVPGYGVYAVKVVVHGKSYGGMLNIGKRPTLRNGDDRSIEVHIFQFDEQIYGDDLEVAMIASIRPEQRYDSIEALKEQLKRDKEKVLSVLKQTC